MRTDTPASDEARYSDARGDSARVRFDHKKHRKAHAIDSNLGKRTDSYEGKCINRVQPEFYYRTPRKYKLIDEKRISDSVTVTVPVVTVVAATGTAGFSTFRHARLSPVAIVGVETAVNGR